MATPDDIDDTEETGEFETPAPAPQRARKPGRNPGEGKKRGAGKADTSPTWANMQPHPVSGQLKRIVEDLQEKEKNLPKHRQEWTDTKIGKLAGYSDHSRIKHYLGWNAADESGLVRIANALGYELRVVPMGSADSVLARLHAADERELRLLAGMLDLLLDFREDSRILKQLEGEVRFLRTRALQAGFGPSAVADRGGDDSGDGA